MKIAEVHKKYLDSCGVGVYVPAPVSVIEKRRVFDFDFDKELTDAEKADGMRKVDVTTRLTLQEAWSLFGEINNLTYETQKCLVHLDKPSRTLVDRGAEPVTNGPFPYSLEGRAYKMDVKLIDELVAGSPINFYREELKPSGKFSPKHILIGDFKGSHLLISEGWGKNPDSSSGNNNVMIYFLNNTVKAESRVLDEHMSKLEEAIKKWPVEGENPIGNVITYRC